MDQQARIAGDTLVQGVNLSSGTTLEFSRTEDRGHEIRVIYNKVFAQDVAEKPATVTVVYEKSTGQARLLHQE